MTTTVKTCFKCGETKNLSDFYKHSRMGDGHLNKCKECTKKDAYISRHVLHRERVIEYDKHRYKTNQKRRESVAAITASWREKNPERKKAQYEVSNAVRDKRIEKLPCFICGEQKVEAHHPDYSAPLAVVWLCTQHHKDAHAMHYWLTKEEAIAA